MHNEISFNIYGIVKYLVCPKSKCTDFPTHELVK
jgi:hypothetical protein